MDKEFRPIAAAGRQLALVAILAGAGLLFGWTNDWGAVGYLIYCACVLAFLCVTWRELPALLRTRLRVTPSGIQHIGPEGVENYAWSAVRAIWWTEEPPGRRLIIATDDNWLGISDQSFDADEVFRTAVNHVPPAAFEVEARNRLSFNKRLDGEHDLRLQLGPLRLPLSASWRVLIGVLLCTVVAVAVLADSLLLTISMAAIIALPCVGLLAYGALLVDRDGVTREAWYGTYRLPWDEITGVTTDERNYSIVFDAGNKRLAARGPGMWGGPDRAIALGIIVRKLEQRGGRFRAGRAPSTAITRNCRTSSAGRKSARV